MSHLTQDELAALQGTILPRDTPFIIQGVSSTQLSVARHYGGCKFQGREYKYIPPTDELIRDDVIKWLLKYRKDKLKQAVMEDKKKQESLL